MRVDIASWPDVVAEAAHVGLKMNLCVNGLTLDALVLGYYCPDDDYYEIYPNLTQHHTTIEQIFFEWEQVLTQSDWQCEKHYSFIFTHAEKNLPCIVEFRVYGKVLDGNYQEL